MHFDDDDCEEVLTAGRTRLLKTPTGGLRLRRWDGGRWLAYHDSDVVLMLSQALDRASAAEQRIREVEAERDEFRTKVDALSANLGSVASTLVNTEAKSSMWWATLRSLVDFVEGDDCGDALPERITLRARRAGLNPDIADRYYRAVRAMLVRVAC